jgi:uncharacterized protein
MEFIGKCLLVEDKEKILAIGDLHLGFEESLNETGVFVSRKMFDEMTEYLDGVFEKSGRVDKVVLLGDVKHAFGKILRQEWNDIIGLFDYLKDKCDEIVIVKGNHDVILESISNKSGVKMEDYFVSGKYCFLHGDKDFREIHDEEIKIWVMGHGHPAVKLSDGVKVENYKCYLVGKYMRKDVVIVPSFIDVREGSDPRESDLGLAWNFKFETFEVMVVKELGVLSFGFLGRL